MNHNRLRGNLFLQIIKCALGRWESNRRRVWELIDGPGNPKYSEGMVEHNMHFRSPVSTRAGECVNYIVMEGVA